MAKLIDSGKADQVKEVIEGTLKAHDPAIKLDQPIVKAVVDAATYRILRIVE